MGDQATGSWYLRRRKENRSYSEGVAECVVGVATNSTYTT